MATNSQVTISTAEFTMEPVAPLSLDHEGFFSHQKTRYQMVPMGGKRTMTVSVVGQVRVAVMNRDIVRIGPYGGGVPWQSSFVEFASDEKTEHYFTLFGVVAGRTVVVVDDFAGKRLDTLVVSVKSNTVKSYQAVRLQDIRRSTARTADDLVAIMKNVSLLYLRQANVTLRPASAPCNVYIAEDLGDPIDLKLDIDNTAVLLVQKIKNDLSFQGKTGQDFTLVSTWNLVNNGVDSIVGVDVAFGDVVLCEDPTDMVAFQNSCIFAHELAHAFQCKHRLDPPNLLMQLTVGSCKMSDMEIDKINPTGLN